MNVTKFINIFMLKGKKSIGEKVFYETLYQIKLKSKVNPILIFNKGIHNIKPFLEVKQIRIGALKYQIPIEINSERQETLAFRWLAEFVRVKSKQNISERLANEIINNANNEGVLIKKKNDLHKIAEMNRMFLHYRWMYNL